MPYLSTHLTMVPVLLSPQTGSSVGSKERDMIPGQKHREGALGEMGELPVWTKERDGLRAF